MRWNIDPRLPIACTSQPELNPKIRRQAESGNDSHSRERRAGATVRWVDNSSDKDFGYSAAVSEGRFEIEVDRFQTSARRVAIQSSRRETRSSRREIQSGHDRIRFGRAETQSRHAEIRIGRAAIQICQIGIQIRRVPIPIPGFRIPITRLRIAKSRTDLADVFNGAGTAIASIEMTAGFTPYHIGTDFVLGKWVDEMDVECVRRYGLIKA